MKLGRGLLLGAVVATAAAASAARADDSPYESTISPEPLPPGRAGSLVDRDDLDERQPRSTPDALRWEPGVYVQQTSAGQGSPFLRGRTGQQTLLLFDGVRLNNSLFRQGPNQYFFTLDLRTIDTIAVTRGGASTRFGSDAIGGVIEARPVEPDPGADDFRPGLSLRTASADGEVLGGRFQAHIRVLPRLVLLTGAGYRHVGLLEGGGTVRSPETGLPPEVPQLDDDGRTQLGTGFDEATGDVRIVWSPGAGRQLGAALYLYRQFDAPRTDQCPPPLAPISECLRIVEQFHTLGYVWSDGPAGPLGKRGRFTLSFQRQHELHRRDRPTAFVENAGRDDVNTFGATATFWSRSLPLSDRLGLRLRFGADAYHDRVDSAAWTTFTDVDQTFFSSRGQYLDGSHYSTGGAFLEGTLPLPAELTARAGTRLAFAAAHAPADPSSDTAGIDDSWTALVGHAGIEWTHGAYSLFAVADRSFRAPNLDDLTARQSIGPGYQFENPALGPETSLTLELGAGYSNDRVAIDVWGFRSGLTGAIARAPRSAAECPPADDACRSSSNRFQLVNLDGEAVIWGAEGALRLVLPARFDVRAVVSYAWGDGPNPVPDADEARSPLSRIPPLNGSVELRWRWPRGRLTLAAGLRWATVQDRLALADRSDPRIPTGGTPGFAVVDVRATWRPQRGLLASLVFENLGDAAYRYHGSSVNGPGRGIIVAIGLEY